MKDGRLTGQGEKRDETEEMGGGTFEIEMRELEQDRKNIDTRERMCAAGDRRERKERLNH